MSHPCVITDLNRCVSCLACVVACKVTNDVPLASFWMQVKRVGPNPRTPDSTYPDVEMYYLPLTCQHCEDAPCVEVCPTGATYRAENGTVQIDADTCIGCQACMAACPYGVRFFNADTSVVTKCTRCAGELDRGELPACVVSCGGRARFFGDLDEGYDSFEGSLGPDGERIRLTDESYISPFTEDEVYALPDSGNAPSDRFILRGKTWW